MHRRLTTGDSPPYHCIVLVWHCTGLLVNCLEA